MSKKKARRKRPSRKPVSSKASKRIQMIYAGIGAAVIVLVVFFVVLNRIAGMVLANDG